MHRPCVCGARAVHTRAQARVACACTLWHAACGTSMCICARAHAWLQVGVGKHQRLHDGDRVEVFNRELLRHRTASTPPPPTHTPPSLVAGRPVHPSPENLTLSTGPLDPRLLLQGRGRAGRCRPVTSTAVHIESQARTRFTSLCSLDAAARGPRGCQTLSGMHQHIPARAATCIRGAPGRSSVDIENGGRLDVCTVWPLPAARPPACRPPPRATARTGGSPAHAQTLPPPLGKKKKLFDKDRTFISKV